MAKVPVVAPCNGEAPDLYYEYDYEVVDDRVMLVDQGIHVVVPRVLKP